MKLHVKIADTSVGRVLALFDEKGEMLPGQTKVTLTGQVGDAPRLVVEFIVDGDGVSLAPESGPEIYLNLRGEAFSADAVRKLLDDIRALAADGYPVHL